MNKYQSFESYLGDVCPDTGRGGADSALEAYERWVENLDAAEVMDYAERWGSLQYKKGEANSLREFQEKISNIITTEELKATRD